MSSDIHRVVIPVKTNSSRVPNKNFRPFSGGSSLFDIKARQILSGGVRPKMVYVSSEDIGVEHIAKRYGFNFLLRDRKFTLDSASETEWLSALFSQVPRDSDDEDISVIRVTQPLFYDYTTAFETWRKAKEQGYDSFDITGAYRHHTVDDSGHPVNYMFGPWHTYSQQLPKWHQLGGVCSTIKRGLADRLGYLIGFHPLFVDSEAPLIDIDTPDDFEMASVLYEHYNALRSQPMESSSSCSRSKS